MEIDFNCHEASYDKVSIDDFIYKHKCFPAGWDDFLNIPEVKEVIKTDISPAIEKDAKSSKIEPPMPNMFKAFTVSPDKIKAIIIGQDPTPQQGKATGLAFSLKPEEDPRTVPSVFNVLVELKLEGMAVSLTNGDLTPWVGQGVLLLNAALTVKQGSAGSHSQYWRLFTKLLVEYISKESPPSAWILWGNDAKGATQFIDKEKHYIRAGGHPSPMGGQNKFLGGNYFHCANQFLISAMRGGINWQINPRPGTSDMAAC